jgi:transcriptional regulator GlxA family with amidase domain
MAATMPNEPKPPSRRVHVCVTAFPECDPSIIYGIYDTLWAAGHFWNSLKGLPARERLFEPRIVAAEPGPVELITGVRIIPQDTIADVAQTDVVFVPSIIVGSTDSIRNLDRRMLEWIGRMHRGGAQLYAACGGALVLAEAGLLDGREATTHWGYVPLFRRLYPNVTLHEDRVLVQSGPGHSILCSGGSSSWQDLALLLIAKHGGSEEAIRMSKVFLYQWHREGQLPYASMIQNVDHGDAAILDCQTWLAQNYERADVVAQLVRRSGLPKRTFDRRFKAATGYSPLAYVQTLRIEEAKQLLETGSVSVEAIGREVGYEDSASFRRLFRRLAGMPPGDYRRKFQMPNFAARALAQGSAPRRREPARRVRRAAGMPAASRGHAGERKSP